MAQSWLDPGTRQRVDRRLDGFDVHVGVSSGDSRGAKLSGDPAGVIVHIARERLVGRRLTPSAASRRARCTKISAPKAHDAFSRGQLIWWNADPDVDQMKGSGVPVIISNGLSTPYAAWSAVSRASATGTRS